MQNSETSLMYTFENNNKKRNQTYNMQRLILSQGLCMIHFSVILPDKAANILKSD